jgi:hypothetical protein
MSSVRALGPMLAAVVMASGCILAANDDPSKLGTTCNFQGSDTTSCGKCIAMYCTTPLDACCGNKSCSGQLGHLDSCTSGFQPTECEALAGGAPDLYACIATECGSPNDCALGALGDAGFDSPATDAGPSEKTSCYVNGAWCSCSIGFSGNSTPCSEATVGSPSLCCADATWPASGTSCTCEPFSCDQTSSTFAICSLSSVVQGPTSVCGPCCTNGTSCICDANSSGCSGSDNPVATCDTTNTGCGANQQTLSSCAP